MKAAHELFRRSRAAAQDVRTRLERARAEQQLARAGSELSEAMDGAGARDTALAPAELAALRRELARELERAAGRSSGAR